MEAGVLDLKCRARGWRTESNKTKSTIFVWSPLHLLKAIVNFHTDTMFNWNQRHCHHIKGFVQEVLKTWI